MKKAKANFEEQKHRDCKDLHLASPEDLEQEIASIQSAWDLEMTSETTGVPNCLQKESREGIAFITLT